MIYHQGLLFYILAYLLVIVLIFRMQNFFRAFFSAYFSLLISLTIVFHPLTIDGFLAPNTLPGLFSFWMFLEALFQMKKDKMLNAILLIFLASMCNITYSLLLIYYFIINWKKLREYIVPFCIYLLYVSIYLYKYALNYPHNPFFFLPYFIQNVIAPLTLTIFEFSLFKFSFYSSAFTVLLLLFFFSQEKKNPRSRFLWPLIFIPAFGVLYHQWDERYNFWRDLIFSPSSFLCITFAITSMIAFHFPRKFFYLYAAVIISISYMWSYQWKSVSDLIQVSILSLPQEFEYKVEAKRLLVWELFYEKQNKRAENILNALIEENPQNKVLQDDLKHYRAQEEQASKIDNSLQSSR